MAWIELVLRSSAAQQTQIEAALEDLGALSVTLQDAEADTPDERAIFEPGVGETPLWSAVWIQALFEDGIDRSGLADALIDLVPELGDTEIEFREVADADWTRAWMDQFQPMRFGERTWIYPWNIEPPADSAKLGIVRLDPGLAFGTGTHPTTALCLRWLDSAAIENASVIDFGCGSGVLAIAALKLGAARVVGIDNDPQALEATRSNAERNDVVQKMDICLPQDFSPGADAAQRADVLLANILAGPLHDLAPLFAASLRPRGALVISGVLDGQQHELLQYYAAWFDDLQAAVHEGWVRISGVRKVEPGLRND